MESDLSQLRNPVDILSVGETRDYFLDIRGLGDSEAAAEKIHPSGLAGRPWVGIRFDCCEVYTRVYRSPDGKAYRGRCPRCGRSVSLRVGEGGTNARFFLAE